MQAGLAPDSQAKIWAIGYNWSLQISLPRKPLLVRTRTCCKLAAFNVQKFTNSSQTSKLQEKDKCVHCFFSTQPFSVSFKFFFQQSLSKLQAIATHTSVKAFVSFPQKMEQTKNGGQVTTDKEILAFNTKKLPLMVNIAVKKFI